MDGCTTDATGECAFMQYDLLQNLTGKSGIMGRSITLLNPDGTIADCCVIGKDVNPYH